MKKKLVPLANTQSLVAYDSEGECVTDASPPPVARGVHWAPEPATTPARAWTLRIPSTAVDRTQAPQPTPTAWLDRLVR